MGLGGGFDTWLAALQPEGEAALGTLGFDFISVDLYRAVERSLGNRIRFDDAAPFLPRERPLRPREMSLARDMGALAVAAAAIAAAWRDGKGNERRCWRASARRVPRRRRTCALW